MKLASWLPIAALLAGFVPAAPAFGAPTGTVIINGGAAATRSSTVRLTLTATDPAGGPVKMCVSNDETCSSWTPFVDTKSWTLAAGAGVRTVNVWFQDQSGDTTPAPASDSIIVDTTRPTNGKVAVARSAANQLTVSWTDFADALSGVAGYRAVYQVGSAPLSCRLGRPVPGYDGTATTLVHGGLVNGQVYGYRICAIDAAGNISTGATKSGKPAPEANPPTGGVTIENGAAATRSSTVRLRLRAMDESSGSIAMCLSNTATCNAWSTFAASKTWTLAAGNGARSVNVWFRDQWGNTSAAPLTGTIVVDATPPADGAVTLTRGGAGRLDLSWTGFSDADSGIAGYRAVYRAGSAPASCDAGTPVPGYAGVAAALEHTGLVNGQVYGYRVCAVDAAGNLSAGATASGQPVPEIAPPVGCSVTINSGDATTRSAAVTLTLTATDAAAIQMCISNTAACSTWVDFAASTGWTLPAGDGTATVNVWFRDQWGNTTATPVSDSILVDGSGPVDGVLRVSADAPQQLTLQWSGFSDPGSGIASYIVVFEVGRVPASCAAGTALPGFDGVATTAAHAGLVNGTVYGYRVCAVDGVGNVSSGATASGQPSSATCEECHGVDRPSELAPNIMGNGTNPAGSTGTPRPYDDGTWGYNVNGHGAKQFDPDGAGPLGVRAVGCVDCHDLGSPTPGTHLNGALETYEYPGSPYDGPNANTSHLVSDFFGTITADKSWQLNFDKNCYQNAYCHKNLRVHRHETTHGDGVARFGDHNTVQNPKRSDGRGTPYWTPWTINDISVNAPPPAKHYAPCVSCHDPHGADEAGYTSCPDIRDARYHMVRENPCDPVFFCNSNCHRP